MPKTPTAKAILTGAVRAALPSLLREGRRLLRTPRTGSAPHRAGPESPTPADDYPGDYPGDFHGTPQIRYDPHPDGEPDPGEIVWSWVPFEEDHSRGKDRPVLVIGHDGPWLLVLQLSRKDGPADAERERRAGRIWVDIGTGGWDPKGRASEVRVDRIVRIDPAQIRREGAVLDKEIFERVAHAALGQQNGRSPRG